MIQFQEGVPTNQEQIIQLYDSVGWKAYTNHPDKLYSGLARSFVIGAYEKEQLVGLVRAVTDRETILYIQDLLVLPEYQRQKFGQRLLEKMIARYPSVRQKILLTDDQEKTKLFYQACGFQEVGETGGVAFSHP